MMANNDDGENGGEGACLLSIKGEGNSCSAFIPVIPLPSRQEGEPVTLSARQPCSSSRRRSSSQPVISLPYVSLTGDCTEDHYKGSYGRRIFKGNKCDSKCDCSDTCEDEKNCSHVYTKESGTCGLLRDGGMEGGGLLQYL